MQQRHTLNLFIILLFLVAGGVILWQSFQPRKQTDTVFTTPMDTVTQAEASQSTPTSVADAIPVESIDEEIRDTTQNDDLEITIEASDFSFSQKEIRVKADQRVSLTLDNVEGFHDLRIDELNVATRQLKEGESETIAFTPTEPGTYEYYCTVGQHRAMGMVGTLVVE